MDAFATADELGNQLNRAFTDSEKSWITTLLQSASAYLREDIIGAQVFPRSTSTFLAWPENGEVEIPQHPIVSVDAVTDGGSPIGFTVRDGVVTVTTNDQVAITFTYGYASAPEGLKRWACVLVSQTLIPLELKLGLTVGGLSSVALDDFKASFANAGDETGMQLNPRNIALIREQYRNGVHVGGMR